MRYLPSLPWLFALLVGCCVSTSASAQAAPHAVLGNSMSGNLVVIGQVPTPTDAPATAGDKAPASKLTWLWIAIALVVIVGLYVVIRQRKSPASTTPATVRQ